MTRASLKLVLASYVHSGAPGCLLRLTHVHRSHPFIYFPTFFAMKSIVEQQKDPLVYAFHKWQRDIWGSCKALWTIWVPAQLLNFAFVPRYLRVPFGTLLPC